MSLAHTAAEYMLSDALLPDRRGSRLKGLRLELPLDKMVKFVTVGFPLLLMSLAFAQEFSSVLCLQVRLLDKQLQEKGITLVYFTGKKLDGKRRAVKPPLSCHSRPTTLGSLLILLFLQALPYSLLALAVAMYLPVLLWKYAAVPSLSSDLLFIISELDKSYNRSIRLVQHMLKIRQESSDPYVFWDELEKARKERYFEFALLERYLACKQRSHSLVAAYLLRNSLLLLFTSATYLYLGHFHFDVFFQEEFSCSIKTGLLHNETHVPELITCRLTSLSVFQIVSLSSAAVYTILVPVIVYNLTRLCQWDKRLLSIYEMLPAFDLLSRKMLGCPINDLNVILLFLRANISELISFSWLSVLCVLKDTTTQKHNIDTVVDFMTLLAGLEPSKPKHLTQHMCDEQP
nr:pannexin-3 [Meriones unguiculatus]